MEETKSTQQNTKIIIATSVFWLFLEWFFLNPHKQLQFSIIRALYFIVVAVGRSLVEKERGSLLKVG